MFKIAVSFSGGVTGNKRGCVINHIPYALKGQKLLAQGNALGFKDVANTPCKGKSFIFFA